MKIMRWVYDQRKNRNQKKTYYIVLITMSAFAIYLAFWKMIDDISPLPDGLVNPQWNINWLWHFIWVGALIFIFYIWIYYAPIVCNEIDDLEGIFCNEPYRTLYKNFDGWLRQLYWDQPGRSPIFKVIYTLFWIAFSICFAFSACTSLSGIFPWYGVLIFFFLFMTVVLLNYSSCYICIIFVYFLIRVYILGRDGKLIYIKEFPSATYGFQRLSHTTSVIYLYFLLDSLFSTISYYFFWIIVNDAGNKMSITQSNSWQLWFAFLYATLFLIVFGIVSWIIIVLVSRTYLYRLHNEWKLCSLKEYEETYIKGPKEDRNTISEAMARVAKDKILISRWEILLSLTALTANLVTAAQIIQHIL